MPAANASTPSEIDLKKLTWVRVRDGKPYVAWDRIALVFGMQLAAMALGVFTVSRLTNAPFRLPVAALISCGVAVFLIVVVEWQRQLVISGKPTFRWSLAALFWLTIVAAIFFAVVSYCAAEILRGQRVTVELRKVVGAGGGVGTAGSGERITCVVTRSDFGDDDLRNVIGITELDGEQPSELVMLTIENSSVTDAGLRELARCQKLDFLALPSIAMSDETIEAIAQCRQLVILNCDESKLSPKQMACLRAALPDVKLNGKTWAWRGAQNANAKPVAKSAP